MKKLLRIFVVLAMVASVAGCGAASAPPVDLPAPVTGQIDISAPSAEGKSTVTGSAGAVPGGSYVLVINESLEVASNSSPLIQLMNALVPSAYAAGPLPDVCDLAGHWCVIAEQDGSFVLTIDARINDSIVIVIINASGDEISERLVRTVPASDFDIVPCADKGVSGKLTALANPGAVYVALYEGSTDAPNIVTTVDAASGESTPTSIPGCFASGFSLLPYGVDGGRVAMISSSDKLMWVGTWNNETLMYAQTFVFDYAPIGIVDIGDDNYVAVTFKKTSNLAVGIVSILDGSVGSLVDIPNPTSGQLTKLIAMDSIGPFADDAFAIGLLSQTAAAEPYAILLDSSDLHFLTLGNLQVEATGFLMTELSDMKFVLDTNDFVYVLIANRGEYAAHVRDFADGPSFLTLSSTLGTVVNYIFAPGSTISKNIENLDNYAPLKIAVNYDTQNVAQAFAITGVDKIWKIFDFLTTTLPVDFSIDVSGASSATGIATALNLDDGSVIIGNGTIRDISSIVN